MRYDMLSVIIYGMQCNTWFYINIKEYGMKRYNSMEVEVIKLGLFNIEDLGLSSKEVLEQSVIWLREKYETTGDARYLEIGRASCRERV